MTDRIQQEGVDNLQLLASEILSITDLVDVVPFNSSAARAWIGQN
ncbi:MULTISPECIES: hypothetical protein [Kamptonema]|nr:MULTISPECIES: hypothetical protein [Kamptonema]CBN55983.1 hypothetical protein OSCI_2610005 [Kamptonema sp. PCC 6506]